MIIIFLWVVLTILAAKLAIHRGHSAWWGILPSIFLTPVIAMLLILLLENRSEQALMLKTLVREAAQKNLSAEQAKTLALSDASVIVRDEALVARNRNAGYDPREFWLTDAEHERVIAFIDQIREQSLDGQVI